MKKMWKKVVALVVCVGITVSVAGVPVQAWELNGRYLTHSLTLIPYSAFTATTKLHMQNAVYQWNSAAGRTFVSVSSSSHSNMSFPTIDGKNQIYKVSANENYVGCTISFPEVGPTTEADMNFNTRKKFANSAQSGCFDTYSIFLHEVGHIFGLKDLSNIRYKTSVMYYETEENKLKRTLAQDDKDGAKALYNH